MAHLGYLDGEVGVEAGVAGAVPVVEAAEGVLVLVVAGGGRGQEARVEAWAGTLPDGHGVAQQGLGQPPLHGRPGRAVHGHACLTVPSATGTWPHRTSHTEAVPSPYTPEWWWPSRWPQGHLSYNTTHQTMHAIYNTHNPPVLPYLSQ